MVMYDYNANAILATPLKNCQAKPLADAWESLYLRLSEHGHPTKKIILDTECSSDFKMALKKQNKTYELTPPHMYQHNAAERAIRTFKNHCLSGFATFDKDFPLAERDQLLDQAELTLNLLRTSRVNPNLSAHAYLFGNQDFNKIPLAPPGTKVLIHKKSKVRASWEYHGVEGWYVGPSWNHYRCLRCYNPDTFSEVDTDTLQLIPNSTPIPVFTDVDAIKQAVADILHILKNPAKSNIPTVLKGDSIKEAFKQVAQALDNDKTTSLPAQPEPLLQVPHCQSQPSPNISPHIHPQVQQPPVPPRVQPAALPRVRPEELPRVQQQQQPIDVPRKQPAALPQQSLQTTSTTSKAKYHRPNPAQSYD